MNRYSFKHPFCFKSIIALLGSVSILSLTQANPQNAHRSINRWGEQSVPLALAYGSMSSLGNFGVPTQSERYFGTGIHQMEHYIRQLQNPSHPMNHPLTIHNSIDIGPALPTLEDPRLHPASETPPFFQRQTHPGPIDRFNHP